MLYPMRGATRKGRGVLIQEERSSIRCGNATRARQRRLTPGRNSVRLGAGDGLERLALSDQRQAFDVPIERVERIRRGDKRSPRRLERQPDDIIAAEGNLRIALW